MKAIETILRKPHEGNEPHKKIILRAMVKGEQISSMWGSRHGIVQTTNRCREMILAGIPIITEKHKKFNGVRFNTYFLPEAYLA